MATVKKQSPVVLVREHARFGKVRVVFIDGSVWFVGKDVAAALGYKNTREAVRYHVDASDIREQKVLLPSGGTQKTVLINKSGVYSLILDSQLPEAKEYRHWITSEVLPSLDETGSYVGKQDDAILAAEQLRQQIRREGIDFGRRLVTDAIQKFNQRDFPDGDKDPMARKRYASFTRRTQYGNLGQENGYRDTASVPLLGATMVAEQAAAHAYAKANAQGLTCKLAEDAAVAAHRLICETAGMCKLPTQPTSKKLKEKSKCIPLLTA